MWNSPQPNHAWGDIEQVNLLREMWGRVIFSSFKWTPPAVPGSSSAAFVIAPPGIAADVNTPLVTNLRVGQGIAINPPAPLPAGLVASCLVVTNGRLHVDILNASAGPLTPPAGAWTFWGVIV
jgi:hypothetical protein